MSNWTGLGRHVWGLVLLSCGLLLGLGAPAGLAAQTNVLDPTVVLLDEAELPAGYVRNPEEDRSAEQPGVAALTRWYELPGSGRIVNVIAYATDSPTGAQQIYSQLVQSYEHSQGLTFEPVEGLGEEGAFGYLDDGVLLTQHAAFFRQGTYAGGVVWIAPRPADLRAEILALAERMVARTAG